VAVRRLYRYVGPADLLGSVHRYPTGRRFSAATHGPGTYTYVVDANGHLLLAPRETEHVVCAGGGHVLGAGELTIENGPAVSAISNQSTGYCPDVASWPAVANALTRAGLPHPDGFTEAMVFRRCPEPDCAEINLVKEDDFACTFCGTELPAPWNVDEPDELLGWAVVANVAKITARGEGGLELRSGLKHFSGGAKLWVAPARWGDGGEKINVVGRHRGSKRYIAIVVPTRFLTNFRVRGIYSPTVYRLLTDGWHALWPDQATAQRFCEYWNQPRLRAHVVGGGAYLGSVSDPPPLDLLVRGETYYLAHFNANRAVYTREPPPTEP
jgi:hypothetical protein